MKENNTYSDHSIPHNVWDVIKDKSPEEIICTLNNFEELLAITKEMMAEENCSCESRLCPVYQFKKFLMENNL